MCCAHLFNDPLLQQALLLGSHDKVVGVVFVVDNILKINTWNEKWNRKRESKREREWYCLLFTNTQIILLPCRRRYVYTCATWWNNG